MPKVSIIVPFYNVEKYIEKCLQTLVDQTLEDIEIILVNDGSKDKTIDIVKKYQEMYPTKIVYLEKANGGLSDARNYAIPYAKGEYIAFLDSDDYVETTMYQEMYEIAKKENSDMVECNFIWEYPNKSRIDVGTTYNGKHEMLEKVRVVAWNKLIKREILAKSKVQFPKGYRYEDVEFTYKLIPYLEKVSFCKTPMVHYIQRIGSITNIQNKRNAEIFDVMEHVIEYYKKNNMYTELKIEDNGTGIDAKDLPHIFERFYKGKNSSSDSVGIGLALSKSIIESNNGYIQVDSELNKGTTFIIKYLK